MEILMPVETEEEYEEALRRISSFEGNEPDPGSPEGRQFEALLKLIDQYEKEQHGDVGSASPAQIVEFMLEQHGLSQAQLAREIDVPRSRISDIVNKKREPTRSQIKKLSSYFNISADLLIETTPSDESPAAE